MSRNPAFTESLSADPIERAIARKVQRILGDASLSAEQRIALVRRAQEELVAHRNGGAPKQAAATQRRGRRRPVRKTPEQAIAERRKNLGIRVQEAAQP